jgi:hypothetical protein
MTATQHLIRAGIFSTHLAAASFGIATLLLLLYRFIPTIQNTLVIIGLWYVFIAILANTIVFLHLFYCFVVQPMYREYFAVKMLLMLINIPIAIFYLYLIIINFNL